MARLCNLGLLIIPAAFLYFQLTICTGVNLGGKCTENTTCTANVSNSECVNNHSCQCSATFYKQNRTCQPKKALGHPCKAAVECSDHNAICLTNCTCKPSHYKDNKAVCQQLTGVLLGGSCTMNTSCIANVSNSECKNKTCQCSPTYYQENNTCQSKKTLECPCKADVECSDMNAVCHTNCTCKSSYYKDNNTVCQQRIPLGGPCAMSSNCIANVSNSECKNKTCQCAATFYQENKVCHAKNALEHPCKADIECSDVKVICRTNCTCKPSHYKDKNKVCQQRVPIGGSCTMNTSCKANVSNSECRNKTCQCAPTYYEENKRCYAKKALEHPCKADGECSDINAVCHTNCTCKPSYYKNNNTVCQQQIPLGGPCAKNTSCIANVSNSECKNSICHCVATFYQENKTCNAKKTLGYPCNADVECSDVNAICSTNCTCKPSHYKDNNTVCQQRVTVKTDQLAIGQIAWLKKGIHPSMTCGSSDPEDASCVANAFCNRTHVCVCHIGYTATKTSCNSAMTLAKLEISTIIMCFILACLGVLK